MLLRFIAAAAVLFSVGQTFAQDSEEREGGIVGTGIVGVITELGSIYVNGQKIEITNDLQVTGSVPGIAADELKPGLTVAVVVRLEGDIWRAEHIRQVLPLVGPVEAIGDGMLTVLGTQVDLGALPLNATIGDWVAVSGLWKSERVSASSIDLLPDWQGPAEVSGTYFRPATGQPDRIGRTEISGISPRHLSSGDFARITGSPVPGGIEAERLESGVFDARVGVVQVEGFYSEPKPDGLYTVLGSGLIAFTDRPGMIDLASRTIQCGIDGKLGEFSSSTLSPEEIEAVRTKLECL